jgi:RHS repeat-associated protein
MMTYTSAGLIATITDPQGHVTSYAYDSFGNKTASSGSLTNFFRYTGREFDTETGLYFNRARYLDPSTGRFISEDPFREVLRGLNFYTYVRNDPVGYTDPNGKSPWDWWDELWGWLGFGKTAWNAASSTIRDRACHTGPANGVKFDVSTQRQRMHEQRELPEGPPVCAKRADESVAIPGEYPR